MSKPDFNIAERIEQMIDVVNDLTSTYEEMEKELKQNEGEFSDLIHEITLGKPKNPMQAYKIYARLRELGQRRYELKNTLLLAEDFRNYIKYKKNINKPDLNKMLNVYKSKSKARDENAKYVPNVREDLTIAEYRKSQKECDKEDAI